MVSLRYRQFLKIINTEAIRQVKELSKKEFFITYDKISSGLLPYYLKKEATHKQEIIDFIFKMKENKKRILNPRYWQYKLNFRGLLLYMIIYKEIEVKKNKKDKEIFNNVISNPSILEIAPFLNYLTEFKEYGFPAEQILLEIAGELRNQLHLDTNNDDNYLLCKATERYFFQLETHFSSIMDNPLSKMPFRKRCNDYISLRYILYNYRKRIIPILREWIDYQTSFCNFYDNKCKVLEIVKDCNSSIMNYEQIISLRTLARKNNIELSAVLSFIKDSSSLLSRPYTLFIYYLISPDKLNKLNSLMQDALLHNSVFLTHLANIS